MSEPGIPGNEWYWAYWGLEYFRLPIERWATFCKEEKLAYMAAISVKAASINRQNAKAANQGR